MSEADVIESGASEPGAKDAGADGAPITARPIVLFDLDDTLMAHREAVEAGIAHHMLDRAYEGDSAGSATFWHELEERHYHSYLAGELTFEGQRQARARDFAAAHGDALDDASASLWFNAYFERYREAWSLHADVRDAFGALERALPGVRFGVITNGEADFQQAKLARLGLESRFEHVVASGAFGATKPAPEIFRHTVELFAADAPVGFAAYVGDRLRTDAIGAAEAGLTGVWLNRHGVAASAEERAAAETSGVLEISTLAELAPVLAPLIATR